MTKARSLFAALSGKDGRVCAVGGLGTAGLDDTTETYDPVTNTWTQEPASASVRRYGHGAAQDATGRVFVVGGTTDGDAASVASRKRRLKWNRLMCAARAIDSTVSGSA